jgi:hypothetical protein
MNSILRTPTPALVRGACETFDRDNLKSYPIYDSRVDKYLWSLQKPERFTESRFAHDGLWDYPKFLEIMSSFHDHYGLGSFTFKEIDKFLWLEGEG